MKPIYYIPLLFMLFLKFVQSVFDKRTSNEMKSAEAFLAYGSYSYALSAIMSLVYLLVTERGGFSISFAAILISAMGAVSLCLNVFCSLSALKNGAIVLVMLFSSAGLLVPSIAGIFLFNERMSIWQLCGIAMLIFAAYLLAGYSNKISGKLNFKTVLFLIGTFLSNGFIMLSQKLFGYKCEGQSGAVFSFFLFGLAGLFYIATWMIYSAAKRKKPKPITKKVAAYGAILSLALFLINCTAVTVSTSVPSVIQFSFVDGGGMIVSAITGAALYGEKITKRSAFGIAAGLAALFIINML